MSNGLTLPFSKSQADPKEPLFKLENNGGNAALAGSATGSFPVLLPGMVGVQGTSAPTLIEVPGGVLAGSAAGVQGVNNTVINSIPQVPGQPPTLGQILLAGVEGVSTPVLNGPPGQVQVESVGVHGRADDGIGVKGDSVNGTGIKGVSSNGEGVHGDTNALGVAGVAGFALNQQGTGAGVFGRSEGKGEGVHGETRSATSAAVAGTMMNPDGTGAGLFGRNLGQGHGVQGETNASTPDAAGVYGVSLNATAVGVLGESKGTAGLFRGNVRVNGNMLVTGTLQVEADIILPGADCAEEFDTGAAGIDGIEPGTVMVLGDGGALEPSTRGYDRRVAGVVSGAGNYRPGLILDRGQNSEKRVALALVGKVYCRVDAEYAPIAIGDLLTTSPTVGHAMKASDPALAFGSVIGKALRPLESGQGLLPILVALQ
jgi:hypothetical protein